MNKWDKRFLDLASLVATWSKDKSTHVGAVIVGKKNRVVSLGFNGPPHGVQDSDMSREEKLLRVIHSEENAILHANRSMDGCTIYVTHHPCARCMAKLIQVGIDRVVYIEQNDSYYDRWREEIAVSIKMAEEAGVKLEGVSDDN